MRGRREAERGLGRAWAGEGVDDSTPVLLRVLPVEFEDESGERRKVKLPRVRSKSTKSKVEI
jgi:hypothetical protein